MPTYPKAVNMTAAPPEEGYQEHRSRLVGSPNKRRRLRSEEQLSRDSDSAGRFGWNLHGRTDSARRALSAQRLCDREGARVLVRPSARDLCSSDEI